MLNILWYILFQFICLGVVFGFGLMYEEEIKGTNDWKTIVKFVFIILLCQVCAYESASGAFTEIVVEAIEKSIEYVEEHRLLNTDFSSIYNI